MNEQALRFRVGVFVLSSLILLAVLVTLFGGFPSVFKRQDEYTLVFRDAPGVGPGTPVRKSGVRVGEVQSVRLDDQTGEVEIKVVIERPYTIRANERPTLVHGLLGGDTTIDFVTDTPTPPTEEKPDDTKENPAATAKPAPAPDPLKPANEEEEAEPPVNPPPAGATIPPGTRIQGIEQGDARRLINDISRILPSVEQTLKRFDRMAPEIDRTIREYRALAREGRETIPAIRKTNDELYVAARYWGRVAERLDVLIQTNQDKVVKTLDNINETMVRIGNLFSDENQRLANQSLKGLANVLGEENQKNLNETLKNMRRGTENLDVITRNTDEFIKEGQKTLKRVNESINETDEVLRNLNRATKPMADRSAAIMHNLDESTDRLNRLTQEAREVLRAFQGNNGTLSSLLNDPTLYNNLNDVACMMKHIMPRLDRAMKDMELFADKIARHPESLGLGGVVTPGSGVKR